MNKVRNWFSKTLSKNPKIPPLPDEILLIIFEYLTPEERIPLCAVCKRFRTLELQIGNRKFDDMCIAMCDETNLYTKSPSDLVVGETFADYGYSFVVKADGDFEAAFPDISKCFKGTTTKYLIFSVFKNREPKPSKALRSIIDLIAYKEIFIYLHCEKDFTGFIIRISKTIKSVASRTLKYQNLMRLNVAMQCLPKLERLSVFEDKNDITDDFIVNGQLMLTMIKAAPRILLKSIDCTTLELLEAFEIVYESRIHKDVFLFVARSVADNLLAIAEEQGYLVEGHRVVDYAHDYAMYVVEDSTSSTEKWQEVAIRRLDADGNTIVYKDSDSD